MIKRLASSAVQNTRSWVTTAMGVIGGLLTIATVLGYITPDQAVTIEDSSMQIITGLSGLMSIVLIFVAKDPA